MGPAEMRFQPYPSGQTEWSMQTSSTNDAATQYGAAAVQGSRRACSWPSHGQYGGFRNPESWSGSGRAADVSPISVLARIHHLDVAHQCPPSRVSGPFAPTVFDFRFGYRAGGTWPHRGRSGMVATPYPPRPESGRVVGQGAGFARVDSSLRRLRLAPVSNPTRKDRWRHAGAPLPRI